MLLKKNYIQKKIIKKLLGGLGKKMFDVVYVTSKNWDCWWIFLKISALGMRGASNLRSAPGGRHPSYATALILSPCISLYLYLPL